jgi:6-pyruvoyltetrahydropterin/6-carboxytetrahydropterin synthase
MLDRNPAISSPIAGVNSVGSPLAKTAALTSLVKVSIQMEIFRIFHIEAAHRLPQVPADHKCARLHGHSFRIEVHVAGEVDQDSGWVQDFADIKAAFEPVSEQLDHRYLNDVPGLENPTSENLAIWIWNELSPELQMLSRIVVQETCNCGCSYEGPK